MARIVEPTPASGASAKLPGQPRNIWVIAIPIILLVAVVTGLLVYKIAFRKQSPLPATQAETGPPLPTPPALPQVSQGGLAPPALPDIKKPQGEQAPVTEVTPPAPKTPGNNGSVVWRWALYPVSPQILGVPLQASPGMQFVALGVTITNGSTAPVAVDHNAFRVNVDGRIYSAELISSAITFQQMPFLVAATLQPGASMNGCVGYMVPQAYRTAQAEWQPAVPEGVKVERVDPGNAGQLRPTTAGNATSAPRPVASGEGQD